MGKRFPNHYAQMSLMKLIGSGAHYWEPATLIISQCNGIFTDQSVFRYFSLEKGQFQYI